MSVMIVGADHLGNMRKNLEDYGIKEVEHICGRKTADRKRFEISRETSLVVVLVDFVNHGTAKHIKEQAKSQGIRTIFAQRSWCSLQQQLERIGLCAGV